MRISPSGVVAAYTRVHAQGPGGTTVAPDDVITFAGAVLVESLRWVVSGTDLRYIGRPRVLVHVSAFASVINNDVAIATAGLAIAQNNIIIASGPPVSIPAGEGLRTVVAGTIVEMVTNETLGLRVAGAYVSLDHSLPQMVIIPVGDGEIA